MSKYLIRVELHKTETRRPNYRRLHAELLSRDFRHLIKDKHGVIRKLPPATYAKITTRSAQDVQADIASAVAAIPWSGNFGAVVADVRHISVEGLRHATISDRLEWLTLTPPLVEG